VAASRRATERRTRRGHSDEAQLVRQTVEAVHDAVPDLDQCTLSMATKIHFIVRQREQATKLGEIPALANQLGWRLSDEQVKKSVELLQRLDLLTVAGD
jgi:hypothetical protein